MTDEEINRRIAEICGWTIKELQAPKLTFRTLGRPPGGGTLTNIPSYTTDLNACRTMIESLAPEGQHMFWILLSMELFENPNLGWQSAKDTAAIGMATPAMLCKAFLRTHGMEVEG